MFFAASKILGFFALPSNLLIAVGIVGLVLLCTRFTRLGSWLVVTSLVLIAIAGLSPLGNVLMIPLEQRFPAWDASRGAPDGIVVLGGAITPEVSAFRDAVALNEAAERITVAAELARRYPAGPGEYAAAFGAATTRAAAAGFLLDQDVEEMIAVATAAYPAL